MSRQNPTKNVDPIKSESAISIPSRSLSARLVSFIEHPLFLCAFGVFASIVGLIYTPFLLIVSACVIGAFHRAEVVRGRSWKIQLSCYVLVYVGAFAAAHYTVQLIKRNAHIPTASEIAAAVTSQIKSTNSTPSEVLFNTQFKELQQLDDFIGRKDERALRETFDFPNMIRYNIRLTRQAAAPELVSPAEVYAINSYFEGGQARVDSRFMKVHNENYHYSADPIPGKFGITNTSAKYVQSRAQLANFIASPELPADVIEALKNFDAAVERDTVLMVESINASYSEDPLYILRCDDISSKKYYGVAQNRYFAKFVPLKPLADKVNNAIRESLERYR